MRWSCKRKTNMATSVKRSLCRMTQNQSNQKGQNSLLHHKHKLYAFCTMAKFIKILGVWQLHSNVGKQKTNKQSWEPLEKAGIAGTRSATCLTYPGNISFCFMIWLFFLAVLGTVLHALAMKWQRWALALVDLCWFYITHEKQIETE